jgi:hypothetical protein
MQLHYRAAFDLTAIDGSVWADVIKTIRAWVQRVVGPQDQIAKAWFFRGGTWRHPTAQRTAVRVETAGFAGDHARCWAVRCEHPDREFAFRQWCIDIAVTMKGPELFGFSMILTQGVLPGFIGDEPPVPVPSAPNLVHGFLEGKRWTAVAGSEELRWTPRKIPVGEANALTKRLTDTARNAPIVYASRTPNADILIDAKRLAWLLAGTAVVYVPESPEVDHELQWFLPWQFRAQKGMVRIYAPGVKPEVETDARRHRFFTPEQITERTPAAILEMIVRGIARRGRPTDRVATIEDVIAQQHQLRILELKRTAEQQPSPKWISLLEEVNASLESDAQRYRDQIETLTELSEAVEAENELLKDENRKLKYEKQQLIAWHADQETSLKQLRDQQEVVGHLNRLPDCVSAAADLIEKLHPTTVEFTLQAKQSAKATAFTDTQTAWRILWAAATTLHGLYFNNEDERLDIARRFKELTGFDLALSEGRNTTRDNKLMALRKQDHNGSVIDITA